VSDVIELGSTDLQLAAAPLYFAASDAQQQGMESDLGSIAVAGAAAERAEPLGRIRIQLCI
ncbi:MAG: hypothetical protein WAL77_10465, partial [Candidatus Dormiibacterota bacterium]